MTVAETLYLFQYHILRHILRFNYNNTELKRFFGIGPVLEL